MQIKGLNLHPSLPEARRAEREILPGVPNPKEHDMQGSQRLLPGLATPIIFMASQEIVQEARAFYDIVSKLEHTLNPPPRPQGFVGGPGSIHPAAYKSEVDRVKSNVESLEGKSTYDQQVISHLQNLMNRFSTSYHQYIGLKAYWQNDGSVNYKDLNSNPITQEQADQIKTQYRDTINELYLTFYSSRPAAQVLQA